MSRKSSAKIREVNPDAKFGNVLITKFINAMMLDGKKSTAEKAFYGALEKAAAESNRDPSEYFEEVIATIRPSIELRSRRVGGATFQVPTAVRSRRQNALALRWIISSARSRKDKKTFADKLHAEFIDIPAGRGGAVKKLSEVIKMAEANKAYSHLNW